MDKLLCIQTIHPKNVIHSPSFYFHTHQLKIEGDLKFCMELEHTTVGALRYVYERK